MTISIRHKPVMAGKVARILLENRGAVFIDATAGSGGHTAALLQQGGINLRVLALDIDPDAIERLKYRFRGDDRVVPVQADFRHLEIVAGQLGFIPADGILADLGQSQEQLDDADRGFSFQREGTLDMRYDRSQALTAGEIINQWEESELTDIFRRVGGERRARAIAQAIVRHRPISTTLQLAGVVRDAVGESFIIKTLSRVFMALRVVTNDELNAIRSLIQVAVDLLNPKGRMVVLSYDSNQDLIVKETFYRLAHPCICPPQFPRCLCGAEPKVKLLTPKPIKADPDEVKSVRAAQIARLRAIEKLPLRPASRGEQYHPETVQNHRFIEH